MRPYEEQVFADFKKFANVAEYWPLYDSIVIGELIGSESTVPGWFSSFVNFSNRETHQMFKNRTTGVAGEQYTNLQNGDVMDFAYIIDSIGLSITGPPTYDVRVGSIDGQGEIPGSQDAILPQWWRADFPWHVGIQLKVQQDIRLELPAMACPSGLGGVGDGVGFQQLNALGAYGEVPWMFTQTTQGVPVLSNRMPLPERIGVPRTGNLEVILHIGEWARRILALISGPNQMVFNVTGASPFNTYFSRYMIGVSLFGQRLVQQRDQYHS